MNPNRIKFEVKSAEINYKSEFHPPIFEIALPQSQAQLLKGICQEFDIKFRDIIFNTQALSSGLIYFRRTLNMPFSFFDTFIGVDEIHTVFMNPKSDIDSWLFTLKVMDNVKKLINFKIKKQIFIVNLHCSPTEVLYPKFIQKINNFKDTSDSIISKGASFSIKTPWEGCSLNIGFEKSMLIEDGLFLSIQAFYDDSIQEYQNIFDKNLLFLKSNIEPLFNIEIAYQEGNNNASS